VVTVAFLFVTTMSISLNFPKRIGCRPRHPVQHYLAISGQVETLQVEGLPEGLRFEPSSRVIVGSLAQVGCYCIDIFVSGNGQLATGRIELICGEQLMLTPPLGWSSWNYFGKNISDEKVREMAREMVDTGLIDYGYSYINIDDGWQGRRCPDTQALQPNEKFPDMKDLCDYVHGLGLKIGIYSTPWRISYAGFVGGSADTADGQLLKDPDLKGSGDQNRPECKKEFGAFPFHEKDARQFAEWGFDYLKYDWNPIDIEHTRAMSDALRHSGRDIVFSLSNSASFELACEWARLSHVWRTTGDITDSFKSTEGMKDWEHSVTQCGFMTADRWGPYVGPGHWADPDMLVVGNFGLGDALRESRLSYTEQKVHVTQWSMLASPILLGCDIAQLKEQILDLLKNEEVLAVNQDVLGLQARRIKKAGRQTRDSLGKPSSQYHGEFHELEVWSKVLSDGSRAVALYNLGEDAGVLGFDLADIGLSGTCKVRDLWSRRDLEAIHGSLTVNLPVHDALLIKVTPAALGA
jgi:alpha-galactosidase